MTTTMVPSAVRTPVTWRALLRRGGRVRTGRAPERPAWSAAAGTGGPVVTITAAPGTPGSDLAERVARALTLALVDAEIPERVAARLEVPLAEAQAMDGIVVSRLATGLAWASVPGPCPELIGAMDAVVALGRFHEATVAVVQAAASAPGGAVIVGRGAAHVLAAHRPALHVRLDAPVGWRADRVGGLRRLRELDRATARHTARGHGADPRDRRHYGLVLDAAEHTPADLASIVTAEAHRCGVVLRDRVGTTG